MPTRHISNQSFDDILSELGDDPAIPDPHGIRKPTTPKKVLPKTPSQTMSEGFSLKWLDFGQTKTQLLLIQSLLFICLFGVIFVGFDTHKSESRLEMKGLQEQLSTLNKELSIYQENWGHDLDDIYTAIDKMEVSIHSFNKKAPSPPKQNRISAISNEADLRRWRYLGLIKTNGLEYAFFDAGKGTMMVAKDGALLGDWRLIHFQKEMATAVHPLGKSIHFKSVRSE